MAYLAIAVSRHGATLGTLFAASTALAVFAWMISIAAAELDSIPVAVVISTMILLPLASPLARLGRPARR